MTTIYILLTGFTVMLVSLSGALFASRGIRGWTERNLHYLTSFAAGVFAVTSYNLLVEVTHLGGTIATLLFGGVSGAVFLELASRLVPHAHHHHAPDHDAHAHSRIDARRMLLGDAIHNIGDGLILVPAFLVSPILGFATALGVVLHELVQEIAEYFVLRQSGYTMREALLRNLAVSGTIFVGILAALTVGSLPSIEPVLLSFAAGGFVYIIIRDLAPNIGECVQKKHSSILTHAAMVLAGAALIGSVSMLVPHTHDIHEDTAGSSDHETDYE